MCYVNDFCAYFAKRSPTKFVQIVHPLSTIFVLAGIVYFFSVQMFFIAPKVYKDMGYKLYWILAIFITHNILGNWIACYKTSSSVESLPKDSQNPAKEEKHVWRFCDTCKKLMPPRSWHCRLCKCCILRRDHHCIFTATCIGQNNQRYFLWFLFHLSFALVVSLVTFCIYLNRTRCSTLLYPEMYTHTLLYLICDAQPDSSKESLFETVAYLLIFLAGLMPGFMLVYQIQILCLNATYNQIYELVYDLGFLRNCKVIMGQRGLWTFLSPLLKSPLPHDGTKWEMKKEAN
ncbi:hypothetical protein KR084_005010 [Drosophila pseudotakahashii]|nr:hypothetical protein KR084_005010 [Drosophila pseudotakahashii]